VGAFWPTLLISLESEVAEGFIAQKTCDGAEFIAQKTCDGAEFIAQKRALENRNSAVERQEGKAREAELGAKIRGSCGHGAQESCAPTRQKEPILPVE
jgi:hypothetical protein